MILNYSLLLLILLTSLSSEGSASAPMYERLENLKKLIEEKKKMANSEVADETVNKLAKVLVWFGEQFSHEIIEMIFATKKQTNLSDKQIQTVLFDFKVDGAWQSAISTFYLELPSTHRSTSIVEKKVLGKRLNNALKKQLKRGFTLTHTLNKIWNENYKCWQALNHPLRKWKAEQKNHRLLSVKKTNENGKRDHLVGKEIYRMVMALSDEQETKVIELLKQLLHCDKSTKTPSFPLISNKSLVLEVKAEFRLLGSEWVNINALEQEILQKEIKKSVKTIKKDMSGAEVLVHGVLLPIYVALYMSVDVPIIVAKATKYHFKYTKPRDKFGQHLIESLTMLKERYQHLNALHHTHSDILSSLYIALEAKEEKFEIEKSSLREKLQRIEVLSEAGRELIALGLARFTTAETANKVLQHLESKQLNESDLRTVFVLNSKLNDDLIKELLGAGKNFSQKLNELLKNAVENSHINMNESSLERNIQKFVGQCQNEMASVEKRLSNFILELSVQIANLRIKLNHAEISGTNQNDDSSLSLSEAIFFITDKEQNEADWTANASEHITAKGSFLSAFWANSNLRISIPGTYYKDLQKESVIKIKLAQQEIAKIVLADLAVKHSDKGATKATEIDGSTTEQQIRKAIFHHVSASICEQMIVAMHNGVIDENGINKGGIDSEKGWKYYVKQLINGVGGSSIDWYSLGTEILGIDREHYENLCAKEFALKDMLEHELKNSEGIHIHNVLRSPEIENLIPKVYLDTTSIYKCAWWDHSIPKLLERIHGKSQSEKVYSQYRDELGVWKLVRRRCQKCNKDIWNGNICKRCEDAGL